MTMGMDEILLPENWSRAHGGPLYAQFSQHIEQVIRSGQLEAGTPLPSERDLAKISNFALLPCKLLMQFKF